MTTTDLRPLSPLGGPRSGGAGAGGLNPNVRALLLSGVAASTALAIALGISLSVPNPNFLLLFALSVGALGLVALAVSSRLEVTVMLLAFYLGVSTVRSSCSASTRRLRACATC